jgi:hypothetical protein
VRVTALTRFQCVCVAAAVGAAIVGMVKGHPGYIGIPLFCGFWILFDLLFVKLEKVADARVNEEEFRERLRRWRFPRLSEAKIEKSISSWKAGPKLRRVVSNCALALIAFGGLVDALVK